MRTAREILNIRLSGTTIDNDVKALALEEAERVILNYCGIQSVPYELNFVWANMAHDVIVGRYMASETAINGVLPSEVKSIRAGDMTVERGEALTAHRINLDDLTAAYKGDLDKFRRITWGHNFETFGGCTGLL